MTIYENVATEAIASFFYHEPLWKKEILFNFLLEPFDLKFYDIIDVSTQDNLKGTIPDFTIKTENEKIKFEVKINDAALTFSEGQKDTRNAYLIRENYYYINDIPVDKKYIFFWEDLFELIDKKGAMKEFARLALVREYMKEPELKLLLTPHEVAMFYSPETIRAVYTMKEKILKLCENFVDSHSDLYEKQSPQDDECGIGYVFTEKKNQKRTFFIGLSPVVDNNYYYSIALELKDNQKNKNWYIYDEHAYFSLDKEILAKFDSEKDLQEEFNKNAEEVLKSIDK